MIRLDEVPVGTSAAVALSIPFLVPSKGIVVALAALRPYIVVGGEAASGFLCVTLGTLVILSGSATGWPFVAVLLACEANKERLISCCLSTL